MQLYFLRGKKKKKKTRVVYFAILRVCPIRKNDKTTTRQCYSLPLFTVYQNIYTVYYIQ